MHPRRPPSATPAGSRHKGPSHISVPVNRLNHPTWLVFGDTAALGVSFPAKPLAITSLAIPWLEAFLNETGLSGENPPIALALELHREADLIRAAAWLEMTPHLECARCNEPFQSKVSAETRALFFDEADYGAQSSLRAHAPETESFDIDDEDRGGTTLRKVELDAYTFTGQSVVLDEFLLDLMQTSLPSQPLCQSDCLGLCQDCGRNLNQPGHCLHNHNKNQ